MNLVLFRSSRSLEKCRVFIVFRLHTATPQPNTLLTLTYTRTQKRSVNMQSHQLLVCVLSLTRAACIFLTQHPPPDVATALDVRKC